MGGHGMDSRVSALEDKTDPIPGNIVGTDEEATLTNKLLDAATVKFIDTGDPTKTLVFDLSAIQSATTRTLGVPNRDDTIVTENAPQGLSEKTLNGPLIDQIFDFNGNLVLDCTALAAEDPVHHWVIANANAGGGGTPATLILGVEATGDDVSLSMVTHGTGQLMENATPVALSSTTVIPNTTAADLTALKADFNTLLAALRLCRITRAS